MLKALLVDDEANNLSNLEFLLQHDCEGINVAGKARSAALAREWLKRNDADVIFLDINMPGEDGFQFLNSIDAINYKIIFVTAYNEFALRAIKASAVDYILKPIDVSDLQKAVEKVQRATLNPAAAEQHQALLQHFIAVSAKQLSPQKIALPQLGSIRFIEVDDIVSLQADSNYTIVHLKDMQKLVISKTMKDFEELLDENLFVRIHKSYIINLRYLKEYSTIDGGVVKMKDGNQWSVSRRQLDIFIDKMKRTSLVFGK